VEDGDSAGRRSRDNFSAAVSGYLERSPHALCREIAKNLFVPKITILRVLEE
jgi:hypothetical protein